MCAIALTHYFSCGESTALRHEHYHRSIIDVREYTSYKIRERLDTFFAAQVKDSVLLLVRVVNF